MTGCSTVETIIDPDDKEDRLIDDTGRACGRVFNRASAGRWSEISFRTRTWTRLAKEADGKGPRPPHKAYCDAGRLMRRYFFEAKACTPETSRSLRRYCSRGS